MRPPKSFTLETLYYFTKQFVQYQTRKSGVCSQYQTYYVIERESDITSRKTPPRALTDRENNYYFSRSNQIERPALFVFHNSTTPKDVFGTCLSQTHELWFYSLDQVKENCVNCDECEKRSTAKVRKDAADLFNQYIGFLRSLNYVKVDNETEYRWESELVLEKLIESEGITSYKPHTSQKEALMQSLELTGIEQANYFGETLTGVLGVLRLNTGLETPCSVEIDIKEYAPSSICCK